ncbi:MAG: aminopeptidase [Alicyclobacillus macrosporangiidus]|uniref:aminopeptidase n=1 Tax=Alicyclobacillus macrosporangiidus TaxID=392015 RepID=UPI0026F14872|nr:aminopeptidase [Alicyclobacillus macrosporangiidus]MCL6598722.1 aminopeptidase [Alicyclobacillus macrosporangiidus]
MREQLRKYAELAVKVGVNLQRGQHLVIGYGKRQVYPEHAEFARLLTEVAYEAGARFVEVDWGDEAWIRETVRRGDVATWEARARSRAAWVERLAEEGAAFIAIPASDPDLYSGIDHARVTQFDRTLTSIFKPFNDRRTNDEYSWTLVSAPTQAWANKVFPNLPESERVPALWKAILACARADGDDPLADWQKHLADLRRRADWINGLGIRSLHYKGPGTDLTIEFHPRHFWKAAGSRTPQGVEFVANIPTEEVFAAPLKAGVNGVVSSTMPLNHAGSIIDGIQLRFENGRIVEYHAKVGEDALRSVIESDEGSHYLGEVALVPADSPIARRGVLFYNTLFDENASCHLAIGKAYPLVEGGQSLAQSDWETYGLNDSLVHVDFMIGSDQLDVEATTRDGRTVPILRRGLWAAQV